jgi:hypothetical protein
MKIKIINIFLIIFILLILTGCGIKSSIDITDQIPLPPVVYFQEIPEPIITGKYNRNLLNLLAEYRKALALANDDKKQLYIWFEDNFIKNKDIKE